MISKDHIVPVFPPLPGTKQQSSVDSQIWHLPMLTGRADRSDRSGLYSPSRIRVFAKSPFIILLVKVYVFPGL